MRVPPEPTPATKSVTSGQLAQDFNAGSKIVGLGVILIFKLLGLEAANLLRQISGPLQGLR